MAGRQGQPAGLLGALASVLPQALLLLSVIQEGQRKMKRRKRKLSRKAMSKDLAGSHAVQLLREMLHQAASASPDTRYEFARGNANYALNLV